MLTIQLQSSAGSGARVGAIVVSLEGGPTKSKAAVVPHVCPQLLVPSTVGAAVGGGGTVGCGDTVGAIVGAVGSKMHTSMLEYCLSLSDGKLQPGTASVVSR